MTRYLLTLLVCLSASAQLPVVPMMASISGLTEPTLTNLFIDIAADNATSITNTVDGSNVTNMFNLITVFGGANDKWVTASN